jgi:hypothetical protein
MFSIIGAILGAAVKGLMAFFLPSKDEKLGKLEVENADQAATIKEDQTAKAAADAVDRSSDSAADALCNKLNERP